MTASSAKISLQHQLRKTAQPFWQRVTSAAFDRFFLARLLRSVLWRFRSDRFARVRQGGLLTDKRTELSRVFVDLDVTDANIRGQAKSTEKIVASWMKGKKAPAARPQWPALDDDHEEGQTLDEALAEFLVPMDVVLGGPGQGKSTVCRFMMLIHASILLLTCPPEIVGKDFITQNEALEMERLLLSLEEDGIPWPSVVRLPILVELRRLVSPLLGDQTDRNSTFEQFVDWLALDNFKETDDADTLRITLERLPWVMIFDGLDEVPPERGRELVRRCVKMVRSPASDTVDGFVVGTSRPQSYAPNAFGLGVRERVLEPLDRRSAQLYAQRFATCIYDDNEIERDNLLEKLNHALTNDVTTRLMSNPLLVTIMATIVMHHGEISDRRWTLFDEYYQTLYRREMERKTYLSSFLSRYRSEIDALHAYLGLALQVRSEDESDVSALVSEAELRALWTEHLRKQYTEGEIPALVDGILRAAEQRLVFLVQSEEGRYGFELRSFQEFMAAKQLLRLPEAKLDSLLRTVAPLNAWRNVVLFVQGALWANSSPHAEGWTVGLCRALNEQGEPIRQAARLGSRLAVDILKDAPYGAATKPRNALQEMAALVSDEPPDERSPEQKERQKRWGEALSLAFTHPSPSNLASVLELDRHATQHSSPTIGGTWPLRFCEQAIEREEDRKIIANRLRREELGNAESWAKLKEHNKKTTVERMQRLAASTDPLRACLVDGDYLYQIEFFLLNEVAQAIRTCSTPWVRGLIAQLWLDGAHSHFYSQPAPIAPPTATFVDDLFDIFDAAGTIDLGFFDIFQSELPLSLLPEMLERTRGSIRRTLSRQGRIPMVPALVEALRQKPDSARLQKALIEAFDTERYDKTTSLDHVIAAGDTVDAVLIRLLAETAMPEDIPRFAHLLVSKFNDRGIYRRLAMLEAHPDFLSIANHLLQQPDISQGQTDAVLDAIASHFAYQPSGLGDPDAWIAAGLPAPPPMKRISPTELEPQGARIATIEIENFRAFPHSFRCDVPATPESGQWLVFLGENGTGKTSLLRALAMALASPADAANIPSNLEASLRRDESRPGIARVLTQDGRVLDATIEAYGDKEKVVGNENGQTRPFVVGYGCRRGSAISGEDYQNAFRPFRDLDNLFDKPLGLIRAAGWLKELQRRYKNNGKQSKEIYDSAREALRSVLLDAESILVGDEVEVLFKNNRKVPLDRLSDGYLTTTGWIVDLMARWLKRNEGRRTVEADFPSLMEGVVLIDEIDLHLHPRWQERVIEDVRTIFPKMTFVVTTHHGLTLRGAKKGEIFVLGDHENDGRISAIQRDIPPGTRIDQLITGEWFNRPSAIVDQDTRDLLDQHQKLLLAQVPAGTPERKELEEELRRRLGQFAETSLERLTANIVAQHLEDHLPEPSAEKREQVRDEVLAILAKRETKQAAKKKKG